MIKITLKDGSIKEVEAGLSISENYLIKPLSNILILRYTLLVFLKDKL